MSKAFLRKHMAALDSGTYPEGCIRGMRRALDARWRRDHGYSVGQTAPDISGEELVGLGVRIESERPLIEAKQAAKGLAWLRKVSFKSNGDLRKNCPFGERELFVIRHFSHFTLAGFVNIGNADASHIPVYRVHSIDGRTFCYHARSWQAGGGLVVIG